MGTNLNRSTFPPGHTKDDFECFGPVATKDGDFANCKLADLGCFKQEGVDSNKYYHCAQTKSKKTKEWFLYKEYGRTKDGQPDSPQYQFMKCSDEQDCVKEFVAQCNAKNTKRGVWEKVGSKDRLVPKGKKDGSTEDLYVVRYLVTRQVGLPAAHSICNQDSVGVTATAVAPKKSSKSKLDQPTRKLFRDLLGGAVSYTRTAMVGGTMPALSAIQDARELLLDAIDQIGKVGNKVENQVKDSTLKKLTYNLYGMIPKAKAAKAAESEWILSQENIGHWQDDLDAFETALKSAHIEEAGGDDDVMQGIPADVESIPLDSELGKWLIKWWPSTATTKYHKGTLKFHNIWKVTRHGDRDVFNKQLDTISKDMPAQWNQERPAHIEGQKQRPDLTPEERKKFWTSNTALLFHGSRSVNVPGIIRESFRFPSELRNSNVTINAAMFGGGVYTADSWSKSANYCSGKGSAYAGLTGRVEGREAFMFACDTILGVPYVAKKAEGFSKAPSGCHCVMGKSDHTVGWHGALLNNEFIIYQKGRIVIRYLAEVSW